MLIGGFRKPGYIEEQKDHLVVRQHPLQLSRWTGICHFSSFGKKMAQVLNKSGSSNAFCKRCLLQRWEYCRTQRCKTVYLYINWQQTWLHAQAQAWLCSKIGRGGGQGPTPTWGALSFPVDSRGEDGSSFPGAHLLCAGNPAGLLSSLPYIKVTWFFF